MKKIYLSMLFAAGSILTQAQVGVNQDDPKATLDVVAKTDNTSDKVEGLLIPRVDKAKALKMATNADIQESTMIYVNVIDSSTGTAVADITETGYYFWNGTKWVKVAGSENGNSGSTGVSDNIYTADGTLTSNRTVNTNGKNLVFTGTGKVGIGTNTPSEKLEVAGSIKAQTGGLKSELSSNGGPYVELRNPSKTALETAPMWRIYNMTDIDDTTSYRYKNGLTFWSYSVSGSTTSPSGAKMFIGDNGRVGIGTTNPTTKLEVYGNIKMQTPGAHWLEGKTGTGGLNGSGQRADSYHSFLRQATSSENIVTLGGIADNFGIYVYDKDRTDNGVDHGLYINSNTGNVRIGGVQTFASPTEKLEVFGSIKSTALAGTGTRNVVADANGKLIIGDAGSSSGTLEITNDVKVVPNTTQPGPNDPPLHANGLSDQPAEGTNLRNYNGTSVPDYAASDYMIVLTNTGVNGKLELPSAAANPGRIIYLINGTAEGLGFSGLNADGTSDIYPYNFTTLSNRSGVGFVSTGKTWYPIGR